MAERILTGVLSRLRKKVAAKDRTSLGDRDLLNQFLKDHNETAITILVERHGPMVLGICRRVLGNGHDAEDASQAVFLVLVRKAGSIRKKQSLASWLHGVAFHVATNLKRDLARRRVREAAAKASQETAADDLTWREMRQALDEELARLPDRLRAPLVLCYLEGKTRDEAAQQLRWSLGVLRGRLERGRELLRARLTRRDITLSGAMLASYLGADSASATMPQTFLASTINALIAARMGAAGAVPANVAVLADGALRNMSTSKFRFLALVSVLFAGVGVALAVRGMPQNGRPATAPQPPAAQGSKPPGATSNEKPAEDPTKPIRTLTGHTDRVTSVTYSADGRWLATASWDGTLRLWDTASGKEIRHIDVPPPRDYKPAHIARVMFSLDGKLLVAAQQAMPNEPGVIVWDRDSGKKIHEFEAGTCGLALSPDGKTIACGGFGVLRVHDLATGKMLHELRGQQTAIESLAFSPDGTTLYSTGPLPRPPSSDGRERLGLVRPVMRVWDLTSGKERRSVLNGLHMSPLFQNNVLSPDGRNYAIGDREISLREVATNGERVRFIGHINDGEAVAFSLDGRTLATGNMDGTARVWDVASGRQLAKFGKDLPQFAGRGWILSVAFSPDGRTLAAGSLDKTVQIWDVSRITSRQRESNERSTEHLDGDWKDLAGDSSKAHAALGRLIGSPKNSVAFLEKQLQATKTVDAKRMERLIADLGHAQFQVREKAANELQAMGDVAAPALRQALAANPPAESRQRLTALLDRLEGVSLSPEIIRQIRAVEALEWIGTPEARRLIEKLAAGDPNLRLTREAKAATDRLARQPATAQ